MNAIGTEMRIITAGRTGFENDLRRDESIELIRARTSLDAIGELANPIDELSPTGTVILVGPDALTPSESGEFIAAVRQIAGDAKLVLISDDNTGSDAFDAILAVGSDMAKLRSAIGLAEREEPASPTPIADPPSARTPESMTEPKSPIGLVRHDEPKNQDDSPERKSDRDPIEIHSKPIRPAAPTHPQRGEQATKQSSRPSRLFDPVDVLDEALLSVINEVDEIEVADDESSALSSALVGGNTLRAGLAELRSDLGTPTVRFTPGETADEGEPVERSGRVFGALRADGVDRTALKDSALWLADRLAIDEQLRVLREAAFTDELTGAWNRRFFGRFLERSVEQARLRRQDLSLMLFDIDDFKTYNDRYGHAAGDEILVEVVKLLVAVIRPHDRVCRIGGDEFAVIFADGPREDSSRHPASIETIAKRFQRQICEHRFPKLAEDAMGTLTISAGLATFPWEAYDAKSLIELADQLAMQSKRAGKNVITMGPGADRVCDAMGHDDEAGD